MSLTPEDELNLFLDSIKMPAEPAHVLEEPDKKPDFDFVSPHKHLLKQEWAPEVKYTFPPVVTNRFERDIWTSQVDHCYARPYNWRPEGNFLKPSKTLFIPFVTNSSQKRRTTSHPLSSVIDFEEDIDVERVPEEINPNYDVAKARQLMEECERIAINGRHDKFDEFWDEAVSRIHWTHAQMRLFDAIVDILNSYQVSKLTYLNAENEPVMRRITIDKAAQRVRRVMASVAWDLKLCHWLHQLMMDHLNSDYLAAYLEILRTLKPKLPLFVERMMNAPSSEQRMGALNNDSLFFMMRRQWDPVAANLQNDKPKKLPGNPLLIVIPSGPIITKRQAQWIANLGHLAPVVTVTTTQNSSHRVTMLTSLDHLFTSARAKIQEIKSKQADRQIVLVGFDAGATMALQVAQVETVMCVVSLGFSLMTAEGRRGEPDDTLLELFCPTLFVIGQCASRTVQEDLEDLRERMRIETGLIVVGSADDHLRISKKKRRAEGITQSIVDRCIVDEIGDFICRIILSPFPPQIRQSTVVPVAEPPKKAKSERKRYNSNTSSLDSEPPSPKLQRPVGRPLGSKSNKSRLEAKWAAQIAAGTVSSSPPSISPPPQSPSTTLSSSAHSSEAPPSPPPLTQKKDLSVPPTGPKQVVRLLPEPKTPAKKIKTLKPVSHKRSELRHHLMSPICAQARSAARMHNYSMSRSIKTLPPSRAQTPPIKVLENIKLNPGGSKLPSLALNKGGVPVGNVVLYPDGQVKNFKSAAAASAALSSHKFVTSKRQLIGSKPPRPVKKTATPPSPATSNLDIMDLPIIFADDEEEPMEASPPPKPPSNKFVLVNKQANVGNFIITPSIKKAPPTVTINRPQARFTKIILSKKETEPGVAPPSSGGGDEALVGLSPEITVTKVAGERSNKNDEITPTKLVKLD